MRVRIAAMLPPSAMLALRLPVACRRLCLLLTSQRRGLLPTICVSSSVLAWPQG